MSDTVRPAGYSGTPLARKLGLAAGQHWHAEAAPEGLTDWLAPLPADLHWQAQPDAQTDLALVFTRQREHLAQRLQALRQRLRPDAMLWVCWPKKASGLASTVSEDVVRELALPLGWVDVKVCAVSDIWSGLKLVVRKGLR
ncbi:MAG: DUF3052 family protein [Burkholderiaceae bacterium]|nr:DUF3052 family protein [Burkholderiaceae bacterium]